MTFIKNRKVYFNFEILDTFEAGLVLSGYEVKAIRNGMGKLDGSYIVIRDSEAYLRGAHVSPYQPVNTPNSYDPERERKLLLSKKEIAKLETETHATNLTIVPIELYNKSGKIKLKIGLARGKKKADKRESIKKRDTKRDIDRTIKSQF